MTNVGIIGCGQISRFHHEGYARAGARVAHVCDLRPEVAQSVAKLYDARASADYRAILDDKSIQLVSVLTTAATHREICLAAIAAGKGVVCEKTLADNPDNAAAIAAAAQKAGTFFATAYMKRFFPAAQKAKELLADMGPVISIHARSWQGWGDFFSGPIPPEFLQHPSPVRRSYSGGVLVCAGSHVLDLVHWFGGRPAKVTGQFFNRPGMDYEIRASALMAMESGAATLFEACWHPLSAAGYERNGWDERLEINTVKGRVDLYTVKWDRPLNNGALVVHQDAATGRVTEHRYAPANPFDLEMADMLRRFETRQPPMPSAWDGYVVDETIAQITHSATHDNQTVTIQWKDRVR